MDIEKMQLSDIPIHGRTKYPWQSMDIGEYITVPEAKGKSARLCAVAWGRRNGGKQFVQRSYGNGVRIIRVA